MNLLAGACELGLVSRREIDAGLADVSTQPSGRPAAARPLHTVTVRGHPVAYVKVAARSARTRERQTLQRLSQVDLAPRVLAEKADDQLWLAALPGRTLRATVAANATDLAGLADICRAWGAALAALHRQPTPASAEPAAPRPTLCSSGADWVAHEVIAQAVHGDRALGSALELVARRWSERYWIHGAPAADHVLVALQPCLEVRFVGFGRAGLGDPGWDLAFALNTIAELVDPCPETESDSKASLLGDYFLHGYRRAGGPGHVHPTMVAVHALSMAHAVASRPDGTRADRGWSVLRWLTRSRQFAPHGTVGAVA
jgi:aminoglycoside phosphotransferase (APT) family kinase protein